MKKVLGTLALGVMLATSVNAGAIIDIEIGGGMWNTAIPTGEITTNGIDVDLATQAKLTTTSDNMYMWAVLDHAIPVVPNIRIEQVTLKSIGTATLASVPSGLGFDNTSATVDTTLDMSNMDLIAYWGVPFATWLPFMDEFDVGVGAKMFSGSVLMQDNISATAAVDTSFSGGVVPYGYAKLRVEPPFMMGIGIETELKYMELENVATFNEVIVKADFGYLAPLPLLDIEVGVEAGYRTMSLDVDVADLKSNLGFNGIFFGVYGKFGI